MDEVHEGGLELLLGAQRVHGALATQAQARLNCCGRHLDDSAVVVLKIPQID